MSLIPYFARTVCILPRQIRLAPNVKVISSRSIYFISGRRFECSPVRQPVAVLQPSYINAQTSPLGGVRSLHTGPSLQSAEHPSEKSERRPLKLMELTELIWPSIYKTLRNHLFNFIIRSYYDNHFSMAEFLDGAEQV